MELGDASAIAVEAKRARKRSRYLSPPYTDTAVQLNDDSEEPPPPDVSAADVLSALCAAARGLSPGPDAAQALHFLALYRRRKIFVHSAAAAAASAGVGNKPLLNLSIARATGTGPAPAMSKKKQKQNPSKPPRAALDNRASPSDIGDVNASNTSSTPPKRTRKNKKMMNDGTGMEHFRNPRLQDLPPMTINVPKLPLKDVRNNLEKMILSLNNRFSSSLETEQGTPAAMGSLVGEMQCLLAKVDKLLQGGAGASSTVHHH